MAIQSIYFCLADSIEKNGFKYVQILKSLRKKIYYHQTKNPHLTCHSTKYIDSLNKKKYRRFSNLIKYISFPCKLHLHLFSLSNLLKKMKLI